ncbi:MAG: carboxypeptidase-like regulatory domain-containing protein, partial [Bacteroidales bacterium]|nr:carboxypeptidase-like regulatory domain-containing protein [Bacteroidales bacterium]
MNIKSIFLLIVVSCFLTSLHAQITGTVYSKDKNSKSELIGANIYWEGTQVGTASDFNGRFSINKPNNSNSLIISYVGYANDTIIVNSNKEELEIILSESNILKEVTVAERTMSSSFDRMNPLITQKINDEALKHA